MTAIDDAGVAVSMNIEHVEVPDEYKQVPAAWFGQEIEMQVSQRSDFSDRFWEPFAPEHVWSWQDDRPRKLYVRFRDRQGRVSDPILLTER
jgi:hypothetical protein